MYRLGKPACPSEGSLSRGGRGDDERLQARVVEFSPVRYPDRFVECRSQHGDTSQQEDILLGGGIAPVDHPFEESGPRILRKGGAIGAEFIGDDSVCLVLGDNIFHGNGFTSMLKEAVRTAEKENRATVFGYWVSDPERYGVAEFDQAGNCLSIEEKPECPKSNYAVVGLYFYPNKVVDVASSIQPSARGEYEITTVNQRFLEDGELRVQTLGRGFAWLDTGTHDSLSEASTYIEVLEKRQGLKVACLEGIAYRQGWITEERMRELAQPMLKNQYGQYLLKVIEELKETGDPNLG